MRHATPLLTEEWSRSRELRAIDEGPWSIARTVQSLADQQHLETTHRTLTWPRTRQHREVACHLAE